MWTRLVALNTVPFGKMSVMLSNVTLHSQASNALPEVIAFKNTTLKNILCPTFYFTFDIKEIWDGIVTP